jgi:hypothetical protein
VIAGTWRSFRGTSRRCPGCGLAGVVTDRRCSYFDAERRWRDPARLRFRCATLLSQAPRDRWVMRPDGFVRFPANWAPVGNGVLGVFARGRNFAEAQR